MNYNKVINYRLLLFGESRYEWTENNWKCFLKRLANVCYVSHFSINQSFNYLTQTHELFFCLFSTDYEFIRIYSYLLYLGTNVF